MRRVGLALVVSAAAVWTGACGSSTQSVTAPSTTKCAVNATANPSSFGPPGGGGTLAVSTNRECQWTASPSGSWMQLDSTSGQGEGNVSFKVASNSDPVARRGTINIGDQQVAISQEAAPCVFNVSPASDSIGSAGGRKSISVTASSSQCSWTARSDVDWLSIVEGSQGTGNGQVTYQAGATTGPSRSGTMLIAGQVVTVTQGEGCTTTIAPAAQQVAATGGSGTIAVTTGPGCAWTAQGSAPWITITSGQGGSGPGTIGFAVAASDGPARTGTIAVNGQIFTVNQESGCNYSIDPSSQSVAAGGATGTVNVHSGPGCTWSASSNANWLTINSGGSGSGDGQVQFTAAGTSGAARSGTLTLAGRTFTVNQAACSYTLNPSSQAMSDAGGDGNFAVNTAASCQWSATSNAQPWLTVTGGTSGTGNGSVNFHVEANPMGGYPRTGTISVSGALFTVNQSAGAACVYTLNPTSRDVSAAAGDSSFDVDAVLTCPWTAVSNVPWIRFNGPASGAGRGTVSFHFDENPAGSAARTGTITLTGQTFTLNQAAGACTYSLSPASLDVPATAGSGTFTVTTAGACTWTATSNVAWVGITAGASGTGSGTVTFTYADNPAGSAARTGTISVNGQTFTLNQAAPAGME
ncbi:MAG: BACON domain-containing protein [Acidobacteriota bacterium]